MRDPQNQSMELNKWLHLRGTSLRADDGTYLVRAKDEARLQERDPHVRRAALGQFFNKVLGDTRVLVSETLPPWVITKNRHRPGLPIAVIQARTNLLIELCTPPVGKSASRGLSFDLLHTKTPHNRRTWK